MRNFKREKFQLVAIMNKESKCGTHALYSDVRLKKICHSIPEDIALYAVRGSDDDGSNANIEKAVLVNHNADLILNPKTAQHLMDEIESEGFLTIHDDDPHYPEADYYIWFLDRSMTYAAFMRNN